MGKGPAAVVKMVTTNSVKLEYFPLNTEHDPTGAGSTPATQEVLPLLDPLVLPQGIEDPDPGARLAFYGSH